MRTLILSKLPCILYICEDFIIFFDNEEEYGYCMIHFLVLMLLYFSIDLNIYMMIWTIILIMINFVMFLNILYY